MSPAEAARRRDCGLRIEKQYFDWGWTMLPTEWADTFLAGIRRIEALIAEQGSGVLVHQYSEKYTKEAIPEVLSQWPNVLTIPGHTPLSDTLYHTIRYGLHGDEPFWFSVWHQYDDYDHRFTDPDGTMDLLAAWLLRDRILVVPMPQVRIVDDRFHCEDGPSIWWNPDD